MASGVNMYLSTVLLMGLACFVSVLEFLLEYLMVLCGARDLYFYLCYSGGRTHDCQSTQQGLVSRSRLGSV